MYTSLTPTWCAVLAFVLLLEGKFMPPPLSSHSKNTPSTQCMPQQCWMEQNNSKKNVRSCSDAGKDKFPSCTWQEVTLLAGHGAPHLASSMSPTQLPASLCLTIMVWTCSRKIYKEAKGLKACCQSPKCLYTPSPFYSERWSSLASADPWPLPLPLSHVFQTMVVPVHITDKPCRCQWSVGETPLLSEGVCFVLFVFPRYSPYLVS